MERQCIGMDGGGGYLTDGCMYLHGICVGLGEFSAFITEPKGDKLRPRLLGRGNLSEPAISTSSNFATRRVPLCTSASPPPPVVAFVSFVAVVVDSIVIVNAE